jgi:hypothetical protein
METKRALVRRGMESEVIATTLAGLSAPLTRAGALRSVVELNSQCLELMAEQGQAEGSQAAPLFRQVTDFWSKLNEAARRRAATCPYLLFDVGFSDPARWRAGPGFGEDRPRRIFTVARAAEVARNVFVYAWHLCQLKGVTPGLVLGMQPQCSRRIGRSTLPHIIELATLHSEWLQPRWPDVLGFWRELLFAALTGEVLALESARMRGLRLLAAEFQAAAGRERAAQRAGTHTGGLRK